MHANKSKFGYVTIIGATNVGKSTLVNALVGNKVSIVTRKQQTTRSKILGIFCFNSSQVVLVDTPGIFKPKRRLDRAMLHNAWDSIKDSDLLKDALLDGTIDYVTSMHEPIDIDNKKVEFDNALSGSIGIECVFGVLSNIFPLDKVIDILTRKKSELSIPQNKIQVGSNAEITLFDPDFSYKFEENHILSTSKNCAFIGQKMNGKVYGVINDDNLCENKLWI